MRNGNFHHSRIAAVVHEDFAFNSVNSDYTAACCAWVVSSLSGVVTNAVLDNMCICTVMPSLLRLIAPVQLASYFTLQGSRRLLTSSLACRRRRQLTLILLRLLLIDSSQSSAPRNRPG